MSVFTLTRQNEAGDTEAIRLDADIVTGVLNISESEWKPVPTEDGATPYRHLVVCSYTDDEGQCVKGRGHEGGHVTSSTPHCLACGLAGEQVETISNQIVWHHNDPNVEDDHDFLPHDGRDTIVVPEHHTCTFRNMGVDCVLAYGHKGDHQSEAGVGFYDAHYVRSGAVNEVQELVHFLTSFGDDNLPVKVRGRHNDSLRSIRWVEIHGNDNGVATHVEIVGY